MKHKAWCSIEDVPYYFSGLSIKFQGDMGWKIDDLNPIWVRLLGQSQLSNPSDLPCSPRHDKTVTSTTVDRQLNDRPMIWQLTVLMQSLPVISKPCFGEKQKQKSTKNVTIFTIIAHAFITIFGNFCVKHVFSTCLFVNTISLSDARPRDGYGSSRNIGICGQAQPYFGKSYVCDLCYSSHSRLLAYIFLTIFSDLSTKSTSPYNYRYFHVMFTSRETIYHATSLMISGAIQASAGPRLTKL